MGKFNHCASHRGEQREEDDQGELPHLRIMLTVSHIVLVVTFGVLDLDTFEITWDDLPYEIRFSEVCECPSRG